MSELQDIVTEDISNEVQVSKVRSENSNMEDTGKELQVSKISQEDSKDQNEITQVSKVRRYAPGEFPKYEVMTDFIFGYVLPNGDIHYPIASELAEKYDCSVNYINQLASKESWKELKTAVKTRLKKTVSKVEISKILSISSTLDARTLENVEKIHDITSAFLNKLGNDFVENMDVETTELKDIDKIPNALQKLTIVMEKSAMLSRKLLGEDERKKTIYEDLEKLVEGTLEEFGFIEGVTDIYKLEDEIKKIEAARNRLRVDMSEVGISDRFNSNPSSRVDESGYVDMTDDVYKYLDREARIYSKKKGKRKL